MPNANYSGTPIDLRTILSSAQAVTADAGSTNVYDAKAPDCFPAGATLVIQPVTIASGQTLGIILETDDNVGFSSATTVFTVPSKATVGTETGPTLINLSNVTIAERFFRVRYTYAGTGTITVTAFLVVD